MVKDHEEQIIQILQNYSATLLSNNLNSLEITDITIIAQCQYLVYKKTNNHYLLQDAFIIINYANIVDPIGAEILMVSIGEDIIQLYQRYPSLFEPQFVEFVSRRTSTSNTGRMNKDSMHIFTTLFLQNHEHSHRLSIMEKPYKFTELVKCVSDKSCKYYEEDLYKLKTTKKIKYCYKAIQSVYNEASTPFLDRAGRLANIYRVSYLLEQTTAIDFNERFILLANSLHNFNVIIQSKTTFNIIDSSYWEISGSNFNVNAFTVTAFNLYNLLLSNQELMNEILPFNCNTELHSNFPIYLLKQVTLQLYKMAKSFSIQDKNLDIQLLKESCFNGMISNITQFTEMLQESKFVNTELDSIVKFVEKHNTALQQIVFSDRDCYGFSALENKGIKS